ncbi:MAG: lycopene cyclase domain-containing protein [Chloroflexi bacterium]|nr:lycopene cyclase domain-containing protein [Chloroflexota bacterium]
MTYFGVLVIFIGPPLVALGVWNWLDVRRGKTLGTGLLERLALPVLLGHVVIALAYTTPWDNYLVATEVWWYDPDLVTGLTLGWVPIEEYTFFIVQTLLSGLLLLTLARYLPLIPHFRPQAGLRRNAVLVLGVLWLVSITPLLIGWDPGTYLALELGWALPPIMLQAGFGADILWSRRRLVVPGILLPTVYLCLVDAIAINSGTWTIDPSQSTGIMVGGVLPIEEVVFFFLTNTLVVLGMTLMLAEESHQRTRHLIARLRNQDERPQDIEHGLQTTE